MYSVQTRHKPSFPNLLSTLFTHPDLQTDNHNAQPFIDMFSQQQQSQMNVQANAFQPSSDVIRVELPGMRGVFMDCRIDADGKLRNIATGQLAFQPAQPPSPVMVIAQQQQPCYAYSQQVFSPHVPPILGMPPMPTLTRQETAIVKSPARGPDPEPKEAPPAPERVERPKLSEMIKERAMPNRLSFGMSEHLKKRLDAKEAEKAEEVAVTTKVCAVRGCSNEISGGNGKFKTCRFCYMNRSNSQCETEGCEVSVPKRGMTLCYGCNKPEDLRACANDDCENKAGNGYKWCKPCKTAHVRKQREAFAARPVCASDECGNKVGGGYEYCYDCNAPEKRTGPCSGTYRGKKCNGAYELTVDVLEGLKKKGYKAMCRDCRDSRAPVWKGKSKAK